MEAGVKTLEGIVRTLKLALEKRIGQQVEVSQPIFAWLVEHSADIASKFVRGDDGITAYRRLKGKDSRGEMLEFGSRVSHRIPGKTQGGLMTPRWLEGVWLGKRYISDEHIVSMPDGRVVRTRAVQALPEETRWSADSIKAVTGLPWAPTGTLQHPTFAMPTASERTVEPEVETQVVPRGITIRPRHTEKFGYSEDCRKCQGLQGFGRNQRTMGHSKECRQRILTRIAQDPVMKQEVEEAEERKTRYLEQTLEESDKKRHRTAQEELPTANYQYGGATSSGTMSEPMNASGEPNPVDEDVPLPDAVEIQEQGEKRGREDDVEEATRPVAFQTLPPQEVVSPDVSIASVLTPESKYLVCEGFSPPRTADRARKRGYPGGWSLDVSVKDPISGKTWDLSEERNVQRVKQKLREDRPVVLTVSPPCTLFSILQNLNGPLDPQKYQLAVRLFLVAIDLCLLQHKLGGAFVLEHPLTSKAWKLPEVQKLLAVNGICDVTLHMCGHGMMSADEHGPGLVFKPTRMLTNCGPIAEKVAVRCCGGHRHVPLMSGRAQAAARYPDQLCDRIIEGALIFEESRREKSLNHVTSSASRLSDELCDMCDPLDAVEVGRDLHYVDGRTGEVMNESLVRAARMEELRMFGEMNVHSYATLDEINMTPGAKIIGTTWVDTIKGTPESPQYKSRLCGQEFARGDRQDELYAPTPPLLGIKLLASLCASSGTKRLMVLDVKRAFLYGDAVRPLFTRLPPEDPRYGTPNLYWRLNKAMYGTRDAPLIWQKEVRKALEGLGFRCCKSNSCLYKHDERDIYVNVHVDDFLCLGEKIALEWLHKALSKQFLLKKEILGPDAGESRNVTFLGRELRWTNSGIDYEPDRKHVQVLLEEWGLETCRGVVSPGQKEDEAVETPPLTGAAVSEYRRAVARLNYLAQDRQDISFATKELARRMAAPCEGDACSLKRLLRYLKTHPRCFVTYEWQETPTTVTCYVDSEWAGCKRTRRSTSGGVLFLGKHCIGHWSRTQSCVALSSGEAELNSAL